MSAAAFQTRRVTVTQIDTDGTAQVRDTLGKTYRVQTTIQRTGLTPAEGDLWLIDKSLGTWTFAAKIGKTEAPEDPPSPPTPGPTPLRGFYVAIDTAHAGPQNLVMMVRTSLAEALAVGVRYDVMQGVPLTAGAQVILALSAAITPGRIQAVVLQVSRDADGNGIPLAGGSRSQGSIGWTFPTDNAIPVTGSFDLPLTDTFLDAGYGQPAVNAISVPSAGLYSVSVQTFWVE